MDRRIMNRAARVAGLTTKGKTEAELISEFQQKYKLSATGECDAATEEKMKSVASSRAGRVSVIKAAVSSLSLLHRKLNLNMKSDEVKSLQKDLAYLGYRISVEEHSEGLYGRTTARAVLSFQRANGLPHTGAFDKATRLALNSALQKIKPELEVKVPAFVIRGSVHDINWNPVAMRVRVSSATDGTLLCERKSNPAKGYFNLPFSAPDYVQKRTGTSSLMPFKVIVSLHPFQSEEEIFRREVECSKSVTWTNFTERKKGSSIDYDGICKGECGYKLMMKALNSGASIAENEQRMLEAAGKADEEMAGYCSPFERPDVGPDILYAFMKAGLLDITALRPSQNTTATILEALFFRPTLDLTKALAKAVKDNLITRQAQLSSQTWPAICALSSIVMLKKRCLEDGASLSDMLGCAEIPESSWLQIGGIFRDYRCISDPFFMKIRASKALGRAELGHLEQICAMGHFVLNRPSCITAAHKHLGGLHPASMAKWEDSDWLSSGLTEKDLPTVKSRVKESYPDEVFIVGLHACMPEDETVSMLWSDVMFRNDSTRLVLSDFSSINDRTWSDNETESLEIKRKVAGIRRIYLLTDDPAAASVLLKDSLTSAVHIRHRFSAKDFTAYMKEHGVDAAAAALYSNVEKQYMRVVSFYNDYRNSASRTDTVGNRADIRTLFGSQDAYSYDKTMSLLGQSAYYADLLRFLGKMPSETPGVSAYDLLIRKRPDLQYIKLDPANSETLLPYVDLVCEILERCIADWSGKQTDWNIYNTTLTEAELLSLPQNRDMNVYRMIYEAPYPAALAHFSLCQEETRAYLKALGIPRYRIMQEYGTGEASIAAEYFGLSALELSSLDEKDSDMMKVWGIDGSDGQVSVREFMRRSGLDYAHTVTLCSLFGFSLFGADLTDKGYPDVDSQFITLDTGCLEALSTMRRFLIIWKHCTLTMQELHSFISEKSGGEVDSSTLIALYRHFDSEYLASKETGGIAGGLPDAKGAEQEQTGYAISSIIPEDLAARLANVGDFSTEAALSEELLALLKERDGEKWTESIPAIYDPIREARRDALVSFVIESCHRKAFQAAPSWEDQSDIYDDLLVDLRMNAPMHTTRIKQATGSVQLFIQRCLLNLEEGMHVSAESLKDTVSTDSWGQWSWMKNYRVWEANRKIFLFPENWIEPELRDDQTPFFKEFLDAADQMEPTTENFEDAILEYLYKLEDVSHLEVCSTYRQIDRESRIDVLHIIARTHSSPTVHYYRSCNLLTDVWSPWEKVETDVSGSQMAIAMYRGKLHLFWLSFSEKALKPSSLPDDEDRSVSSRESVKYYEIQLSWSVRKNGVWTSKTTSRKKLIHPWARPHHSYDLKTYLDKEGRLHLDVYLSTSEEFNNAAVSGSSTNPEFKCRWSHTPHNETYRPWHSSTFLFEGHVTEVYMRDMGVPGSTSLKFVNKYFGEDGRNIKKLGYTMTGPALLLPSGMHLKDNRLTGNSGATVLYAGEDLRKDSYNSRELLSRVPEGFEMVLTQQTVQMDALQKGAMLFYQDNIRSYSIRTGGLYEYRFSNFYHPFTSSFISSFNKDGADALFTSGSQNRESGFSFGKRYKPVTANVCKDYPEETVDFSMDGAYATYNWELFFHIPLTIACRLSAAGRYEDAMKWFHYIFNPVEYTESQVPQCFWVTEPFRKASADGSTAAGRIETLLKNISSNSSLLSAWKNNPFKPHIIARFRTDVYQKMVVRKYIENLIAWADDLFRQDTWETINEAILLYQMAAGILGDRPEKVAREGGAELSSSSFKEISGSLDILGNKTGKVGLALESMLAMENLADISGFRGSDTSSSGSAIPTLDVFYFNVPSNDLLVGFWDTVEDRLFKIRNSMNIDGVVRTLSLNAPEIDPAQLVKAAAGGMSVDGFEFSAELSRPAYRFQTVLRKAIELTSETRAMGEKLLGAMEKEDSAQLSEIRAELEVKALDAQTRIKELDIESTRESLKNLEIIKKKTELALDHYENIEQLSTKEAKVLQMSGAQIESLRAITALNSEAAAMTLIPSVITGFQGVLSSPVAQGQVFSGDTAAKSLSFAAGIISSRNSISQQESSILSTKASYERRSEEWKFQAGLAAKELESVESQIEGMNVRLSIAERDLENHKAMIQNTDAVYRLIRSQYCGKALYSWLKNETSALYRQMYTIAYSYARKAELCYAFELGDNCPAKLPSISVSDWSSDHCGLLAADTLLTELRTLEQSYMDNDRRCFELTKRVSLSELTDVKYGGSAMARLLGEGECEFDIPEWMYDLDYPTHGNRRIRSVAVTIPCVTGPNTNVNCTLTLIRELRRSRKDSSSALSLDKAADIPETARPSIATSSGVNDTGLFAADPNGEKYLPFEGYGAVSRWKVSLPAATNRFDRSSISDMILDISYYAQEYGEHDAGKRTFVRLLSARHEFPDQWQMCRKSGSDLTLAIENGMVQSYMRKMLSSLVISSVVKLSKSDDGGCIYEALPEGYGKNENTICLKGAGAMIADGAEDFVFVLTCNS